MALIAVAADKGAPGVTTASVALAAVWPRPVLLAECDPAGGDLVYRLPAADGGRLDPRRGLLSLAVAARRGLQPHQVWEHAQKLRGGLDILTGVGGAEQGAGLGLLWGSVGRVLAAVPQADVIADCGRVGVDGPVYDLLAQASAVVLLTRLSLGEVIRLRDRVGVLAAALQRRGRPGGRVDVVVVTDYKNFGPAITEVGQALRQSGAPARVVGGLAYEPKSADQLRGEWSGKLDKSMFIRTARAIAGDLASALPGPSPGTRRPAPAASPGSGQAASPGSGLAGSPGSGLAGSPGSGLAGSPASAPARGPDGKTATSASLFQPAVSPPATSAPAVSRPAAAQPQAPPPSGLSYRPGPGRAAQEPPHDPGDVLPSGGRHPVPGGAPSAEPPARGPQPPAAAPLPAAADAPVVAAAEPPGAEPRRPGSGLPGRLASRGRHAGTPAASGARVQQPPERDGAQQAAAHPPRPEPTSSPSQGRPGGR